jgi:hypothetical protein
MILSMDSVFPDELGLQALGGQAAFLRPGVRIVSKCSPGIAVARQCGCHRHPFPDQLTDLAMPEAIERNSRQPGAIEERHEVALVAFFMWRGFPFPWQNTKS